MKILVIRAAPRKSGITNVFADAFLYGAKKHAEVYDIDLCNKNIKLCSGCYSCVGSGKCIIADDMSQLLSLIEQCDVLACFTPLYFFSMSAQMKAFFDRCFPLVAGIKTNVKEKTSLAKKMFVFIAGSGRIKSFEGIVKTFELIASDLQIDLSAIVRRGECVYFSGLGEDSRRVKKVLSAVERAGEELALGKLSKECIDTMELQISPSDGEFEIRSKLYWNLLSGKK